MKTARAPALGLRANEVDEARQRNAARIASVRAALDRLDEIEGEEPAGAAAIEALRGKLLGRQRRYEHRLDVLQSA